MIGNHKFFNLLGPKDGSIFWETKPEDFFLNSFRRKITVL